MHGRCCILWCTTPKQNISRCKKPPVVKIGAIASKQEEAWGHGSEHMRKQSSCGGETQASRGLLDPCLCLLRGLLWGAANICMGWIRHTKRSSPYCLQCSSGPMLKQVGMLFD